MFLALHRCVERAASSAVTVSSASFTEDIFANLRKKARRAKGMLHLNQALALAVVSPGFPGEEARLSPRRSARSARLA